MLRLLPALVSLLLLGTGCSDDGNGDETGGVHTDVDVALPPDGEPFLEVTGELFVTGDGTVYRAVEQPMGMAPTPTGGPTWEVADLTDEGLGRLLGFLAEHEFFAPPPDYGGVMVTDAGENRLVVTTAEATYEHEAFIDSTDAGDGGDAYDRFRTVLDGVRDLPTLVGPGLGAFEPYVPESWDVVDNIGSGGVSYIDGEVEPWPFTAPAAEGCTTFPDDDVTAANADGATGRYQSRGRVLDVEARLPWDGPC